MKSESIKGAVLPFFGCPLALLSPAVWAERFPSAIGDVTSDTCSGKSNVSSFEGESEIGFCLRHVGRECLSELAADGGHMDTSESSRRSEYYECFHESSQ